MIEPRNRSDESSDVQREDGGRPDAPPSPLGGLPTLRKAARATVLLGGLFLGLVACSEDPAERGRRLVEQGRFVEAVVPLREALESRPSDAGLNELYGRALLNAGHPSIAVFPLEKAASEEGKSSTWLLLGRAQLESQIGADAIRSFSKVLEAEPDHVPALWFRARAYLIEKRREDALNDLDHAIDLAPQDGRLLLTKIEALLSLELVGEAEEAIAEVRAKIADRMPDDVTTPARFCVVEASFFHEVGDEPKAGAAIEACQESYGLQPHVVDFAVEFYDETGQRDRATEILQRAHAESPENLSVRVAHATRMIRLGRAEEAISLVRSVAGEQPAAWLALVDLADMTDDLELGLEAAERSMEIFARSPPSLALTRVDYLIQLGDPRAEAEIEKLPQPVYRHAARARLHFERGRPEQALTEFTEATRLWPDNAMLRYLAGVASEQTNDFDRAMDEYRESIRIDAAETDAGYQLAVLHRSRGEYQAALHALGQHLKSRPHDPAALLEYMRVAMATRSAPGVRFVLKRLGNQPGLGLALLARASREANGPAAAVRAVEDSKLDVTERENVETLSVYVSSLIAMGAADRAVEVADGALARNPTDENLLTVRGSVALESGDLDGARSLFDRALEIDPSVYAALIGLGEVFEASADWEQALEWFDRASRERWDDPRPAIQAARVRHRAGRSQVAIEELERILRRHPRNAEAARGRASIALELGENLPRGLEMARRSARFEPSQEANELIARLEEKVDGSAASSSIP